MYALQLGDWKSFSAESDKSKRNKSSRTLVQSSESRTVKVITGKCYQVAALQLPDLECEQLATDQQTFEENI